MKNSRNGIREWIFQRVSNVLIFIYAATYLTLVATMQPVTYESWLALHAAPWFKIYSSITLVVVMFNAILAGWQIGTDYTQKVPVPGFATLFHGTYVVVSLAYLFAGLYILWGI